MEQDDEGGLDGVGDEVTVPEAFGSKASQEPQNRNNRQRERQRDEERHLVVAVELIHNHQRIDITERDEAEGEDTQNNKNL